MNTLKLIPKCKGGNTLSTPNQLLVKIPGKIFAGPNDWSNLGKRMADNMINHRTQNASINNALDKGKAHIHKLASISDRTITNKVRFKSKPERNIVSRFQADLAAQNFLDTKDIDGSWGPKTQAAWEKAQQSGYINQHGRLVKYVPSKENKDSDNTGLKAIMDHKVRFNVTEPYLFVNKQNNTATLYRKDTPIQSWEISQGGGNPSDAYTTPGWKYYSELGNRATGAGIFTIRKASPHSYYGVQPNGNRATSNNWNGEPIYWLQTESKQPASNAIHGPAGYSRSKVFNNGNPNDNRVSYGCISFPDGSLYPVYNNKMLQTGDTVYINPEMPGNYIYEQNGKLKTKLPNKSGAQKKYSAFNESK